MSGYAHYVPHMSPFFPAQSLLFDSDLVFLQNSCLSDLSHRSFGVLQAVPLSSVLLTNWKLYLKAQRIQIERLAQEYTMQIPYIHATSHQKMECLVVDQSGLGSG